MRVDSNWCLSISLSPRTPDNDHNGDHDGDDEFDDDAY